MIARMLELKLLGVAFAIDDFGTGYSSLSYLKRFPIDILKVDKSFVDDVGESPESGALAEAIVQLGNTLHLQTVGEGIEQAQPGGQVFVPSGASSGRASTSRGRSRQNRSTSCCPGFPRTIRSRTRHS